GGSGRPNAGQRNRRAAAPYRGAVMAAVAPRTPERVGVAELIALRAAGERLRLMAPRVAALTSGGHLAQVRGRGIEYDESRPYQHGDDLRSMDWRVTARTGK